MSEGCKRAATKSIDKGYVSYPSMLGDSFFDSVRQNPQIQNLLTLAKKTWRPKEKVINFIVANICFKQNIENKKTQV